VQVVQVVSDIRGHEQLIASTEVRNPLTGAKQLLGTFLQLTVDLGDRCRELVGFGREQLLDARQGHASVGKRFDLDHIDGVAGGVAPVA